MFNEAPELAQEFPDYKDAIHEMKMRNTHFAELLDQYHELVRHVHRIEQEIETPSDQVVEDLKKQRLKLKDELFNLIAKKAS